MEIRQLLERLYGLDVESVSTLNREGQLKRSRKGFYRVADTKLAYVRLKDSVKLPFPPPVAKEEGGKGAAAGGGGAPGEGAAGEATHYACLRSGSFPNDSSLLATEVIREGRFFFQKAWLVWLNAKSTCPIDRSFFFFLHRTQHWTPSQPCQPTSQRRAEHSTQARTVLPIPPSQPISLIIRHIRQSDSRTINNLTKEEQKFAQCRLCRRFRSSSEGRSPPESPARIA